ncbi:putative cyclopentanonemonooxygenase [Venturia nashicola]|uniref:Putative cyclopentanonemonooxygenase n=1 Tax=Venturia nashicola TaxID=86259 RepID=A0A4Z1NW26_9PEZI|nr:putative cyclopentanonemonooxygenase [Venturia nashicola]TLD21718.1 putative cyclopentanonemonooxygenase [Venturia nashicola]
MSSPDDLDAIIVGTGFSGVYLLHILRKRGFKVKALDGASQLGGIWNSSYPGARVDIEVPTYELNIQELWEDPTDTFIWKERFPSSAELRAYFQYMDRKLDLSKNCRFDTWVERATWDGKAEKWTIGTRDGETYRARFFLPCLGYAAKPIFPELDGLEQFEGKVIHTAQWPKEGLDLADKRVGVIGTGSSGVQVIQTIAPVVKRLTVFQQTPATAVPMQQHGLTEDETTKSTTKDKKLFLEQRSMFWDGSPSSMISKSVQDDTPEQQELEFNLLWNQGGFSFWTSNYSDLFTNRESNGIIYAWWREQVHKRLEDPYIRDILAPKAAPYAFGTKRVPLEQNYYEVFNMDHVRLVDLKNDAILRMCPEGLLLSSGQRHEFEVLILATGFEIGTGGLTQINIRGRDGKSLADEWSERTRTYLGMAVHDFPNMIFAYGPQSPANVCNGPVCAEIQGNWIAAAMENLRATRRTVMEAMTGAEEEYVNLVTSLTKGSLFEETKSYYHADNVPFKGSRKREPVFWMGGVPGYVERIEQVAKNGFRGFAIS